MNEDRMRGRDTRNAGWPRLGTRLPDNAGIDGNIKVLLLPDAGNDGRSREEADEMNASKNTPKPETE